MLVVDGSSVREEKKRSIECLIFIRIFIKIYMAMNKNKNKASFLSRRAGKPRKACDFRGRTVVKTLYKHLSYGMINTIRQVFFMC